MVRAAICFLAMWPLFVWATTHSKLKIQELFGDSQIVALVEIVEGETLGFEEESCGALYTGRVLEQFKGAASSTLRFGHAYGFEIGGRYLLFLSPPGEQGRFLNSTNSLSEQHRAEYLARCKDRQLGWNVMHSGFGAIPLTWSVELNYEQGFAFPTRFVKLPQNIEGITANTDAKEEYSDVKWFKEDVVVQLLRDLAR